MWTAFKNLWFRCRLWPSVRIMLAIVKQSGVGRAIRQPPQLDAVFIRLKCQRQWPHTSTEPLTLSFTAQRTTEPFGWKSCSACFFLLSLLFASYCTFSLGNQLRRAVLQANGFFPCSTCICPSIYLPLYTHRSPLTVCSCANIREW